MSRKQEAIVALFFIIPALIVAGCTQGEQVVKAGDTVTVDYTGTLEDGTVFDSGTFTFKIGGNEAIKGFDEAVNGMKLNETKNVSIPPEKAYGAYDPSFVSRMRISDLNNSSIPAEIGTRFYVSNNLVKIISIDQQNGTVMVDFNHELAGKALNFTITVVKIET